MDTALTVRPASSADRIAWDTAVNHPLQSWAWGEFRRRMGLDTVRIARTEGGRFRDGWQLTFHRVPGTPFTIGYFPRGPLPNKTMIDELTALGRQKHTIFIQLEPNVPANNGTMEQWNNSLTPSHHPLFPKYTFILDLSKSEDQLLAAMHPKTRYNIRVAQKRGVKITEDNSDRAFASYIALMQQTTKRQRYYAHDDTYHRRMWDVMSKSGIARIFHASYEGEVLAAWIVFVWKDTVYYPYGASSRMKRDVMAPNLLLWEIALWAKRRGIRSFDLWGALGPDPDVNDPWYGFHRFKEGYAPIRTELVGSYDLVINKTAYGIYKIADSLRWMYLKLKLRGLKALGFSR